MIIDTNYTSLSVIDENIRHYYSKDVRERVIGYPGPNEEGESSPIVESYPVVVLNQPDKVAYQDVEQRRSERKPWDPVVKSELERAIAWEDFCVNHDQYLDWLDALANWRTEKPTYQEWDPIKQSMVTKPTPQPERPVIDLSIRRAHYEREVLDTDLTYFDLTGAESIVWDDVNLIAKVTLESTPKPDSEVANYHKDVAHLSKSEAIHSDLEYSGKKYQMGRAKDGTLGVDSLKNKLVMGMLEPQALSQGIDWITSSNEVVSITGDDIKAILLEFTKREQSIVEQYNHWRSGNMLTPFTPTT